MANYRSFEYLTAPEIRFLDAAVERLIPTDELGPGREGRRRHLLHRSPACAACGARTAATTARGPGVEGTPQQGFQSRLTPQEIYRVGIRETNQYCSAQVRQDLRVPAPPISRTRSCTRSRRATIELPSVSSKLFFDLLLAQYRGRLLRRPDVRRQSRQGRLEAARISRRGVRRLQRRTSTIPNVPYRAEPVSILDIQRGTRRSWMHRASRSTSCWTNRAERMT